MKRRAAALGFAAVGITTLDLNPHARELDRWLGAGHAGTMTYLRRQATKRKEPQRIMPEARVAIVTLTNYFHAQREAGTARSAEGPPSAGETGRVAQYAWSGDYHGVLARRLARLAAAVRAIAPGARVRCYVDAGPVPERELAQRAGLGWIGKNMMLIHPRVGSFTFIGVVLTDADLAVDLPFQADRCGSCRRCLDACPTDAFLEPHVMDARRCISYLTIERRGALAEPDARMVGDWLFGCDVCQDVCPWNETFARESADRELVPRPELRSPALDAFAAITPLEFERRYGDTAFERAGLAGMRRNARTVRTNQGE